MLNAYKKKKSEKLDKLLTVDLDRVMLITNVQAKIKEREAKT